MANPGKNTGKAKKAHGDTDYGVAKKAFKAKRLDKFNRKYVVKLVLCMLRANFQFSIPYRISSPLQPRYDQKVYGWRTQMEKDWRVSDERSEVLKGMSKAERKRRRYYD